MSNLSDLHKAIDELNHEFPRPKLPPLTSSDQFIISKDYTNSSFPNSDFPGVYIFFDKNDDIVYIGKASSGLGMRLGSHVGRGGRLKSSHLSGSYSIRTIKLTKESWFEAAAIEEFLIRKLNPIFNSIGKSKG